MDYLATTKKYYISLMNAFFKAETSNSQSYYYHQSCALKYLLTKFGLGENDIKALENEARIEIQVENRMFRQGQIKEVEITLIEPTENKLIEKLKSKI